MAQTKCQRILAPLRRQFVHERLDGEHVGESAERPQRGGANWHGEKAMVGDAPGRKIIERDGIALRTAAAGERRIDGDEGRERLGQLEGRQQSRRVGAARPRDVPIAPDIVAPSDDLAAASRSASISTACAAPKGAQANSSSRDHCSLHRPPPDGASQERGVEARHRRRRSGRSSPHLRRAPRRCVSGGSAEDQGQIGAQIVDALAMRPHVQAAVGPLRDRAGGRHRGMRDVRT